MKKTRTKLQLASETIRALTEQNLSAVVGGMLAPKTDPKQPSDSWGPTWCGNDSCWCILSDAASCLC
jgi:hypothetical protein